MQCNEAVELITGLVDGELTADEQSIIEAHLSACSDCTRQYGLEKSLKAQTRMAASKIVAPELLRQAIERQLASPGRAPAPVKGSFFTRWFENPLVRPVFAAALLLMLFVPLYYTLKPGTNVAVAAFPIHQEVNRGDQYKKMAPVTDMAAFKAQLVAAGAGKFGPMGYDLSMMRIYPVAGFIRQLDGRYAIVTVYQGTGPAVTCITMLGSEDDAPRGSKLFHDSEKKLNFYSFASNGVNGVLHQEGDVICIMLSDMPPADLLELVRAKAHSTSA